ncbi:MAG: hypothetical protein QF464_08835, partial [Myxococcota bacterium]|nr:hypothetical protein [Myxococcota bacterium]
MASAHSGGAGEDCLMVSLAESHGILSANGWADHWCDHGQHLYVVEYEIPPPGCIETMASTICMPVPESPAQLGEGCIHANYKDAPSAQCAPGLQCVATDCVPLCEHGTEGCTEETCQGNWTLIDEALSLGRCECVADCAGKSCGPDGCGGSCGGCEAVETCSADGQCVDTCDCVHDGCVDDCGEGARCQYTRAIEALERNVSEYGAGWGDCDNHNHDDLCEGGVLGCVIWPSNGHGYGVAAWVESDLAGLSHWNWDGARSNAADKGGYLATVTSVDEAAHIAGVLDQFEQTYPGWMASMPPWLGGYQTPEDPSEPTVESTQANWRWVTGESWLNPTWANGEPSGAGSNCLEIAPPETEGGDYVWGDSSCDSGGVWGGFGARDLYVIEFDTPPHGCVEALSALTCTPDTAGTAAEGEPCRQSRDCEGSLHCLGAPGRAHLDPNHDGGTGEGTCVALCELGTIGCDELSCNGNHTVVDADLNLGLCTCDGTTCAPDLCQQAEAAVITEVPFMATAFVGAATHRDEYAAEAGPCNDQWHFWEGPPGQGWSEAVWTFEAPADDTYRVVMAPYDIDGGAWVENPDFTPVFWAVHDPTNQGCQATMTDLSGSCLGVAQASGHQGKPGEAVRDVYLSAGDRLHLAVGFPTEVDGVLELLIDRCDGACSPLCGNGVLEDGETCDDGNLLNGDACSADCQTADLVDNQDGTVTQAETGLMWAKCSQVHVTASPNENGWVDGACVGTPDPFVYCGGNTPCDDTVALDGSGVSPLYDTCHGLNGAGGFAGVTGWRVP